MKFLSRPARFPISGRSVPSWPDPASLSGLRPLAKFVKHPDFEMARYQRAFGARVIHHHRYFPKPPLKIHVPQTRAARTVERICRRERPSGGHPSAAAHSLVPGVGFQPSRAKPIETASAQFPVSRDRCRQNIPEPAIESDAGHDAHFRRAPDRPGRKMPYATTSASPVMSKYGICSFRAVSIRGQALS